MFWIISRKLLADLDEMYGRPDKEQEMSEYTTKMESAAAMVGANMYRISEGRPGNREGVPGREDALYLTYDFPPRWNPTVMDEDGVTFRNHEDRAALELRVRVAPGQWDLIGLGQYRDGIQRQLDDLDGWIYRMEAQRDESAPEWRTMYGIGALLDKAQEMTPEAEDMVPAVEQGSIEIGITGSIGAIAAAAGEFAKLGAAEALLNAELVKAKPTYADQLIADRAAQREFWQPLLDLFLRMRSFLPGSES